MPRILKPSTFEERSPFYEDIRSLLNPGFLAYDIEIGDIPLSIRTLTPQDLFLLRHRVGRKPSAKRWKDWLLSTVIWLVDGQVILDNQESQIRLYKTCAALPSPTRDLLYSFFLNLSQRYQSAVDRLEAYMYESESRFFWKTSGRKHLEYFGSKPLNAIQQLWVFYNETEDQRERFEAQWSMIKFQVSPHAPKGIKKLNQSDKQAKDNMMNRRRQTCDNMYYLATGVISEAEIQGKKGPLQTLKMAQTAEELEEEMKNWVQGNKDEHDKIIEFVKGKIRREVEERRAKEQAKMARIQRQIDDLQIEPTLQPYSGEAAVEIMNKLKRKNPGAKFVFDDHTHNSAYDKYIKNNPDVGSLSVDGDRIKANKPIDPKLLEMMRK